MAFSSASEIMSACPLTRTNAVPTFENCQIMTRRHRRPPANRIMVDDGAPLRRVYPSAVMPYLDGGSCRFSAIGVARYCGPAVSVVFIASPPGQELATGAPSLGQQGLLIADRSTDSGISNTSRYPGRGWTKMLQSPRHALDRAS